MNDDDVRCPFNADVVEYRIQALEKSIEEISRAVKSIAETTEKIARLEERHSETREALERAFSAISRTRDEMKGLEKDIDRRLRSLEADMPAVRETSGWVKAGVISLVGLVLFAAIKLSLRF
ncbi:hypothetical protein [Propionivibrio sp.]|uniref:DUF7201 family protein n=1 Tax=Propionivibrio sp. TaxID=2212460 RepID=UPI0039E5CEA6